MTPHTSIIPLNRAIKGNYPQISNAQKGRSTLFHLVDEVRTAVIIYV